MATKSQGKGGKAPKAPTTSTWTTDLVLTLSGTTLTSTVSPNAKWAGIQKFVSPTSNEGAIAIWEAQRYYQIPPGPGATTSCTLQGAGYYRGWSYDEGGHTHVSNWVPVS